jgi:hypothetical protein
VEEEEGEMLPQLEQALGSDRLVELGQAFARRRAAELTGNDGGSGQATRQEGHAQAGDGSEKTKEELYAEARDEGIQGRSSMSKEELAQALSEKQT